jgi:protein TonB
MMHKMILALAAVLTFAQAFGNDTLYFRLSNPWNTVKDPHGKYFRKCVQENDYYHVWDFNAANQLVTESYYADTNFTKKLFCHKYFNEADGLLEQTRCYKEGRLNGYLVDYDKKGDTTDYQIYQDGDLVKSRSLPGQVEDTVLTKMMRMEKKAQFPGGAQGWIDWLGSHLRYPAELNNPHISGRVILRFTITAEGRIDNIQILQSLHPLLDAEAIRVIAKSPKWKPAEQLGRKVIMTITQPIDFQ